MFLCMCHAHLTVESHNIVLGQFCVFKDLTTVFQG